MYVNDSTIFDYFANSKISDVEWFVENGNVYYSNTGELSLDNMLLVAKKIVFGQ